VLPTPPGDAPEHARKHAIKKSRVGKWRAAVLIGVHVLIAAHLGLWVLSGMRDGVRETLSPVEPSESMYALENGLVNAGFIFFITAIISTLVFGRFFCGWGCHIVALQDLCGWIMKKCGVHPKPFRSRLLMFVPLIVALYMFVWPTVKREVLFKLVANADPMVWHQKFAPYLGGTAQFPGWSNHLIVEDFWKTFAPWYVAIPFIFICTFGVVYFLGNKGFCTYGCPYGGFFAPADKFAVGKIKVNDNCEGCGHCTAVCSSNVRVHEEVRDFGMVVDPGCMKCMDCVSVCPNEALSFGFAKPSVLAKPRTPEAVLHRATKKRVFDLSWPQEVLLALVFLGLTLGFRGMLNEVPLLMALGMAGIGTFLTWKLIQLVTEPSTRIHGFQLKLKGKLRPWAFVFLPLVTLTLVSAAWSGWVRHTKWRADRVAAGLSIPAGQLLTPGFAPDAKSVETARRAMALFDRSGSIRHGGYGWEHRPDDLQTIAYLHLVLGKPEATEATLLEIMSRGNPLAPLVQELGNVMARRGATEAEVFAMFEKVLAEQPQLSQVRLMVADWHARSGRPDQAVRVFESTLPERPGDPIIRKDFGMLLAQLGEMERGLAQIRDAAAIARGEREGMRVRRDPESLRLVARAYAHVGRHDLALPIFEELATLKKPHRPVDILQDVANAQYFLERYEEAVATMKKAAEENPDNLALVANVAQMYQSMNRPAEANQWAAKFEEARRRLEERARSRR
jgi:polyferredoxin/tetratricopeptide (TPR) repeat protein